MVVYLLSLLSVLAYIEETRRRRFWRRLRPLLRRPATWAGW
ncbi:hypothetical protein [Thermoproteus tenax]|uniref:Uncharacterized protein n=1 Tax=Thermoproteus tenax (strain ATCC 35583 / DSM 2078 / JCM 9277 / NBRC 100435 / Kra 1) TaxID=768679 RepID=G4RMP9_THETK|nr:hypothetical protein [Thermoproteus tenax]CCC82725.1 hypothetical protein TTX_2113 [Thermoproteus tenax Kra 1]